MTEPPAIIGPVAAVSQLTGEFVTLTTSLRHHLKAIRRAPEEIQAFLIDTTNFTGLLNLFAELAERPAPAQGGGVGSKEQRRRERRVWGVQKQCAYVCDKMAYLVDRFAGLAKGNTTALGSLRERIKYLLDKPDIRDLRLSVQMAAVTVNAMSTLFMWEQATRGDARTASLLEQLRNLLPTVKRASAELAEYRRRHGTGYESGAPDPDNAMLAAAEEIQRQIAHVIRPHARAEADRRDGEPPSHARRERRRESLVVEGPGRPATWASLSRPDGDVAGDMPPRKTNGVSFDTSPGTMGRHSRGRGVGARGHGAAAQPASARRSRSPSVRFSPLPPDSLSDLDEWRSDRRSSGENNRAEASEMRHEARASGARSTRSRLSTGDYGLGMPDPTRPHAHLCDEHCAHVYCPLCGASHCPHDRCPFGEQMVPVRDGPLDDSTPRASSARLGATKVPGSARSSEGTARAPRGGQARHSPHTSIESERRGGLPDKEAHPFRSRPHLSPPRDTTNPDAAGPGSKKRSVRAVEDGSATKIPDPGEEGVSAAVTTLGQRPRSQPEKVRRRRWAVDGWPGREGPQQWESAPREPHVPRPATPPPPERAATPYAPAPPSAGTGGRRRPRRPQSKTTW